MYISPHDNKSTYVRFFNYLKDGSPLYLRQLTPEDQEGLKEGFSRLSDSSRYNRFLGVKHKLTAQELSYLCNPDGINHFALLACNRTQGIGVARCVRDKKNPQMAELAVTVIDSFQNSGVGSILFARLAQMVIAERITCFRGYAMGSNKSILGFLHRYGATTRHIGEGIMEIDIPLYTPQIKDLIERLDELPQNTCALPRTLSSCQKN
jgi:GNAT superfamily N-acetyltransferase